MKNKIIVLATTLALPYILNADVSAVGIAYTQEKAKKEALSALSQIIKSEVRTHIEMIDSDMDSKYTTNTKSNIKITSNLPILGTEFNTLNIDDEYKVKAKLISANVNSLYSKKLKNLSNEVRSNIVEIRGANSDDIKLALYQALYSILNEYDRYESVATILGVKNLEKIRPRMTLSKVNSKILTLRSNINSLDMAASIISESFKQKNIFIYPPTLDHNSNVSDFGSIFQKMLKSKISNNATLNNAKYLLEGKYTLTQKSMILSYDLLNASSKEIVKSKTITINKKAYSHLKVKASGVDFNTLLNSGIAESSDLKVSLNSNRGTESLLFTGGEEIELFVKLNKKGYLYIAAYTQTDEGKLSYLLELGEGHGNSKFMKFINADDASKWINLGAFEVVKPFGIESLQVIASNKKIKKIPQTTYDNDLGYYIVSNNIKKALLSTRGLRPKITNKVEMSEDVMSFRTIKGEK